MTKSIRRDVTSAVAITREISPRWRDLCRQEELRDKEREMWEEKFKAELKMTKKEIELDRTAKAGLAELPQFPFKGTA